MKKVLLFTAYNRVPYFQQALHSWEAVEQLHSWPIRFSIEPGENAAQMVDEALEFVHRTGHQDAEVVIQPRKLGVLEHPFFGFQQLFEAGADFVLRAEDDLIVSNDVLQFFDYCADRFRDSPEVAAVNASSYQTSGDPAQVHLREEFNPLIWGTWRDRWTEVIAPTWDHDYSTFDIKPGFQAGWDWNLKNRVLPSRNLVVAAPVRSRVDNIGLWGTHSTPDTWFSLPGFQPEYAVEKFVA